MTENLTKKEESTPEQSTIKDHEENQFETLITEGMLQGGINLCAFKGHGKTRMLFCLAEELQQRNNVRVIAFDGSLAWLFGYSKIPTFTIKEHDILNRERSNTEDIEKYSLENWNLIQIALASHKDLLFSLKTRKPSKRGFLIRTVINYLDNLQRQEKELNPEHKNSKALVYFLEEASNTFNSRSTSSTETEEFLSTFNEGRNFNETFITATQRLTDFSKTIRAKQLQVIGKLSSEDITPALRRLEKENNITFCDMKARTWLYEGKLIISPTFKQAGKPYLINDSIKALWLKSLPKLKPTLSLTDRLMFWLNPSAMIKKVDKNLSESYNSFLNEESTETENSLDREERINEERDLREIEEEFI